MAANLIRIDASRYSALAVCLVDGCGWRSPTFRTRERAQGSAQAHRRAEHPALASDADRRARVRAA